MKQKLHSTRINFNNLLDAMNGGIPFWFWWWYMYSHSATSCSWEVPPKQVKGLRGSVKIVMHKV